MPGKSWQRKRKHKQQTKSRKSRRSPREAVFQQQAVPAEEVPVVIPEAAALPPVTAAVKSHTVTKNPELTSELRRIGIFAGIMLAVLVLLAIVLG